MYRETDLSSSCPLWNMGAPYSQWPPSPITGLTCVFKVGLVRNFGFLCAHVTVIRVHGWTVAAVDCYFTAPSWTCMSVKINISHEQMSNPCIYCQGSERSGEWRFNSMVAIKARFYIEQAAYQANNPQLYILVPWKYSVQWEKWDCVVAYWAAWWHSSGVTSVCIGFPPGALVSPTIKKCTIVSPLEPGLPWKRHSEFSVGHSCLYKVQIKHLPYLFKKL